MDHENSFVKCEICTTPECLRTAEMYRQSMDPQVHPCDDFYEYTCRNYPNFHEIPPHKDYYLSYIARIENVDQIILDYINKIDKTWSTSFQKVRNSYELCMDQDQIREVGYETLQYELDVVGMNLLPPFHTKTETNKHFSEILGKMHRFSVGASKFLFNISVRSLAEKMEMNILTIGSVNEVSVNHEPEENPPNGGPPTQQVTSAAVAFIESRQKFIFLVIEHLYAHFKVQLTEDMIKEIQERVYDLIDLEERLKTMRRAIGRQNIVNPVIHYTRTELKEEIDEYLNGGEIQFDFLEYLNALFTTPKDPKLPSGQGFLADKNFPLMILVIGNTEFEQIFRILQKTSSSVFESWIWWSVVESTLDKGPTQLNKYYLQYAAEIMEIYGPPTLPPWKTICMYELKTYFGKFVGHVLAKTTNGLKKKKVITEMFKNIKKSYQESIQRTPWSDQETKDKTLKKIETMTAFVGFDNSVLKQKTINREYEKLDIQEGYYHKVLATLSRQKRERDLFTLFTFNEFHKKPEMDPADERGSRYLREYNRIVIPIIDVQFPIYELGLEVLHYATLGYTIAHEVGHAIDSIGSRYNSEGSMIPCMTPNSAKAYEEIVQCFIEAYNDMFVHIPDQGFLQVNGVISVNENMADWQGVNMALMAYKKYVKKHGGERRLPDMFSDLSAEKLFTLAYSNSGISELDYAIGMTLYYTFLHGVEQKLIGFPDLSPKKLFALAYASQNCIVSDLNYIIYSATSTEHAPRPARVNVILKNSSQFTDAYG